ncbi:hypothetical protein [Vibrio chagasii]|uniref:Uncharacterized protein n=1 Tax=Vibrio chagasii TaxID=170679 RepID=A0A7Y4DU04_9VIBR|nr:hypothetical protein [Vibrio chagasii]NOH36026.1 hypothetical protein [Vibrio chagasii]
MKSQSIIQPNLELNPLQRPQSSMDLESLQQIFAQSMDFSFKKIKTDTRIAMLDGAADSLSKALNANIKQTDGINF